MHSAKIQGPALLGFGDFFTGHDEIGAVVPAKPVAPVASAVKKPGAAVKPTTSAVKKPTEFVVRTSKTGRKYTSFAPAKGKTHEQSIRKAHDVAKHAAATAAAVAKQLHKHVTKVKGDVEIGAAPPAKLRHTAHTAQQLGRAATALAKKAKDLAAKASKHDKTVKTGHATIKTAAANAKRIFSPSGTPGKTVVGNTEIGNVDIGEAMQIELDRYYTFVGAAPDPSNPGYLTDGTVDPAFGGADPTMYDPTMDPAAGGYDPLFDDMATDSIAPTKAPDLVPGQDFMPDPHPGGADDAVYSFAGDLPPGCIVYDKNQKPMPWQGMGSLTRFYPSDDNGNGHGPSGFQWGGGNPGIMDGWYWWWHGATSGTEYKHENAGNSIQEAQGYGKGPETGSHRSATSVQLGWGPLVGNPQGWTKGLRYDPAGDRWFWFYDTAPDWARASDPIVGDMVRLQKAILDFQTEQAAIKADALRQAAQDKLDQQQADALAKQQAVEDAAHARSIQMSEEKQASMEQISASQQSSQEQQLALQQAQLEQQSQAMRMQQHQQTSQLMIDQAKTEQAYLAQHPELMFQEHGGEQGEQGGEYEEDQGGGEGESGDGASNADEGDDLQLEEDPNSVMSVDPAYQEGEA